MMSVQQSVSPHKQQSSKHSPKSTEKTKASPNKKVSIPELFGNPVAGTSKSNKFSSFLGKDIGIDQHLDDSNSFRQNKILQFNPLHPYSKILEQKVNQDSDNGKHTPKISNKIQQQTEKNGVKKTQASTKIQGSSKAQAQQQNQGGNSAGNAGSTAATSKQKSCFNQFCTKDKGISTGSSPQQESTRKQGANGIYKLVKLEKTGEKVTFCDLCYSRYQEKHFCYYCQQVYFDEYNIDDKEWIQCDSCDRWCHLHCEDEKIKKAFINSQSENFQYDCPKCRNKENNPSSSTSSAQPGTNPSASSKQTQGNAKASKEKPSAPQPASGTKMKKQMKNKDKEEKKQDQQEQQLGIPINGHTNGQSNSLAPQSHSIHSYSVQTSRMDNGIQSSIKKGNNGISSTNRDALILNCQNDQDIYYSFDNFKRKKNKIFQNKNQQQLYQPVQPLILLPNYTTIEDLLKSAGISVSLDESSIKSDLSDLKRILMDSSDSSFKSTSSNQLSNGIHGIQNGQSYSIAVNQE